jgi:phage virion morphogenesis protein
VISAQADKEDVKRLVTSLVNFSQFRRKFNHDLPRVTLAWVKQRIRTRIIMEKSGPDGEHWPDAEDGSPRSELLYKSRRLVNSFKTVFASGAGQLGSSLPYAAIHHFGGVAGARGRRNYIPARPYFGIGKPDIEALEHRIQAWVDRNLPT